MALPPGTVLAFDAGTRLLRGGVLVGGSPLRVLRLLPGGVAATERLAAGAAVPDDPRVQRLAGRLVRSGLAHPLLLPPPTHPGEVTVVVPVRDDAAGLVTTLMALDRASPRLPVLVVDDGSVDAGAVEQARRGFDSVAVVRSAVPCGPAAARNRGWRQARTPVVAFVDAGCTPSPGWLELLLAYLDIPGVAAAAPRILSQQAGSPPRLGAYEAIRSRLDMGPRAGPVRPGSWVPFVPTAALVVRRESLDAVGGFEEGLATGEDVDLVWRLHADGWDVRYCPQVTVSHPCRPGWRPWLAQRFAYGRSAPALAARHGTAVAPADVSMGSAGVWALVAAGRYPAAMVAAAASVAAARWGKPAVAAGGDDLGRRLGWLATAGHLRAGMALARACRSEWWPLLAAAMPAWAAARRVAAGVTVLAALEWLWTGAAVDPVTWTCLRLVDDMAYGAGVWRGCAEHRSVRALLPRRRRGGGPPRLPSTPEATSRRRAGRRARA